MTCNKNKSKREKEREREQATQQQNLILFCRLFLLLVGLIVHSLALLIRSLFL